MLVKKTDWALKRASSEDRENLITFFNKNLWQDKKNVAESYSWKYENNPAGSTLALIGINEEQNIIATSMFIPWQLKMINRNVMACQWVDLFVEPEYRGQALPSDSLRKGLEESRKQDVQICFAFPNSNSVPIHKKNNGIHLGIIERYTKPLNVEYLVKRRIKSFFLAKIISFFINFILMLASKETRHLNLSGFRMERVEDCQAEFDDLWERFSKNHAEQIMTCKNSAYLNWKYLNNPAKNRSFYALKIGSRLEGFVVLEDGGQIGYIVDILALSKKALKCLLSFSVKYFRRQHKNSVVFVALENNLYFTAFKSFGFIKRPEDKHFYIYLAEDLKLNNYFSDSKNWFITIGDCDIESL